MDLTFQEQTLYTQKYKSVYNMLPQDSGGRLKKYVTIENGLVGEGAVASDQIGETEVNEVVDRYGDSPHNDVEMARRWYKPFRFNWGHLFETADKVRTLGDPKNMIALAARKAFDRKCDDMIIQCYYDSNLTGKDGTTLKPFPADNIVAHSDAGMTVDKLETVRQLLEENDIDVDSEMPIVVLSPAGERQLRGEVKYSSRDYGEAVYDNGKLKSFLGFDFIVKNRLPFDKSSNVRSCPVFIKSAVGLGIWQDLKIRLSERDDKNFLPYLYMEQFYSATRLDEKGCFSIEIKEA